MSDLGTIQEEDLGAQAKRLATLNELSRLASTGPEFGALLNEAVRLVADALDVEYVEVLELLPDDQDLSCRSSIGWQEEGQGQVRTEAGPASQAAYTLTVGEPVIVDDFATDARFAATPLQRERGIVSGLSVVIQASGQPFGVISAHTARRRRLFRRQDADFLQTVAQILSLVVVGTRRERSQATAALQASDARLQVALEAGRMGTWQWDLQTGVVTWSPTLEAIHGLVPGTFDGSFEAYQRDIHPDDRTRVLATITQTVAEERDHRLEYRIVRPDGVVCWLEARGQFLRDTAGQASGLTGVCVDITERKRAETAREQLLAREQELRAIAEAAETRYRDLFDAVADIILVADAELGYVDANRAACDLLGYSRAELLQMRPADLVEPSRPWAAVDFGRQEADGSWVAEVELRRKDGSMLPVETRARRVDRPGRTVYLGVNRDISERRRLAQMQREFLAEVGHELRNPLTSISGYAQLMRRRAAYTPEAVAAIIGQVEALNRLVGDLIQASQSGAGRLELRRSALDLVQEARVCVEKTQLEATLHTVQLETPVGPLPGVWDKDRLGQIFANLLSNAIKYSPDGGEVVVRIEDEGQQARISIVDQGIGIAAEALPRLFDRFYRIAGATERIPGLGLGLHITRDLVESHGGQIWATSPGPGQGSSFTFTLPYRPADEPG